MSRYTEKLFVECRLEYLQQQLKSHEDWLSRMEPSDLNYEWIEWLIKVCKRDIARTESGREDL